MSYAIAPALQTAIFDLLANDPDLGALVGSAIYDAPPPATPPGTYVLLGPEEALDRSDQTGPGAEHRLTISVITDASGFLSAKEVGARISDLLTGADLTLTRGHLVGLWFDRATARKLDGDQIRRIDLRFRARVDDSPVQP